MDQNWIPTCEVATFIWTGWKKTILHLWVVAITLVVKDPDLLLLFIPVLILLSKLLLERKRKTTPGGYPLVI
jgi:hypothetical protein